MAGREDPYVVLGVPPHASQAEIIRAFRARVRAIHPDTRDPSAAQGADDRLQQLLAAYSALRTLGRPNVPTRSPVARGPVNIPVRHHNLG
jgi:curved DNA-binding protein CbpA